MADERAVPADELESLYKEVAAADLQPLWTITEQLLTPTPQPKAVPWLWPAAVMRPLAERSIGLVPVGRGGERRVLSLANPGLGGRPYAAGTLWGAIQALGPHESAPAHRHTPGAIRFVLEGEGVSTTVDGDACEMRPGDLILTPAWNWHDHTNTGDAAMFWFDGLDLPMIEALDGIFFEPYPDLRQPVTGRNRSEELYAGAGGMTHGRVEDPLDPAPSPLLVYRWTETDAELGRLAARGDDPMVSLEFTNPRSGASVLPTLACAMHRLAPGRSTLPVRRSGNAVYVVHRGTGTTVIAGQGFEWGPGDMFVVPSWAPVEHLAHTSADLFTLSDTPVLRALGVYREQTLDTPQTVTGMFRP
ncbi:cupin domain-containing protein [Actinomadura sp. HBU206391]|uniref:cupin domain-containing protein n=1 Tax=Actinomadura sp. HBU206391 TaxID=2731692 RepID=UPI001650C43F|nr:cupin domain-containing protein [Actinomadura sp. HBU206391]MBC6457201.1 cupin domain-containing protein [Actinomadura sp. HBU206391]